MRALTGLLLAAVAVAGLPTPTDWLVIEPVDERGRRPFNPDAVFARYLLDPAARPPEEGEEVRGERGAAAWRKVAAGEDGSVGGKIAYAYAAVETAFARIVLARVKGASTLYVNGDAFVGDVYGMGHRGVPVALRVGTNHLFVKGVRGAFRLEFEAVKEGVIVCAEDVTKPDLVRGSAFPPSVGIVHLNASREPTGDHVPLGVRKLVLQLPAFDPGAAESFGITVDDLELELAVRKPAEARRCTFWSSIDGSTQEYSMLPPAGDPRQAGVVLTLHGAGVDAFHQARSYSPKEGLWIVAPTNRRPFGFDWQDWGRLDAHEALRVAVAETGADGDRVFLTGHSMGGHGVWHLAANDPDRFRAIAPSAGWSSFDSYGGRPVGPLAALWHGADGASLTMELLPNLVRLPTFILHGEKDDNVPVSEARLMAEALREAGGEPVLRVQEGAGHWWDGDAAPGVDCVDWPDVFEHFRNCPPRDEPEEIDFVSADPGVDAEHHWVRLEQPLEYGKRMRIRARILEDRIEVETANVRRFRIGRESARFVVDGKELTSPFGWFLREDEAWTAGAPLPGEKTADRSGPFKRAFGNEFVMVYGSRDEEGMRRARFDAQVWWYRANGDAQVVSDLVFLTDDFEGRNVILYGNADTNAAWSAVLPDDCAIRVEATGITAGERRWTGLGLGCLFVYPRRGEGNTLVGVVGHTGRTGARLGYGLLPFVSGVGYPDYAVFSETFLGMGDDGVLAAGWFDPYWKLPARSGR